LRERTRKRNVGSDKATQTERIEAGQEVMKQLRSRMVKAAIPRGTRALRVYVRVLRAGPGGVSEAKPELLAEEKL
jgi:hypothetical protein